MRVDAVIADDEPLVRAQLRTRLARLWPELDVVQEMENGRDIDCRNLSTASGVWPGDSPFACHSSHQPSIRSFIIEVISSGRSFTRCSFWL